MAVAVLVGVLVIGYLALGMPGMDHDGDGSAGDAGTMDASEMGDMRVGADEFAERMEHEDAVVVNVHVPYEGEIAGTDLFIPYDRIGDDPRLPSARDTEILLYCRTGRMSQEAAAALMAASYTDVVELEGGMQAWQAAGRELVFR